MKYWIGRNGQQLGPYAAADVQRMVQEGNIVATDLAWTEGMAAWAPALEIFKPAAAPSHSDDLAKTRPILAQEYRPPQAATPAAVNPAPVAEPAPAPAPVAATPVVSTPAPAAPLASSPVVASPVASSPVTPAPVIPAPAAPTPHPAAAFSPMRAEPAPSPVTPEPAPFVPPAAPQPQWNPPPSAQPAQQSPWSAPAQSQQPPQPQWSPQPQPAQQAWSPAPAAPAAPWTPQQQYAPPPPAAVPSPGPMAGPVPPGMHWALVWVLGAVTFGIFIIVWVFKQLNFVQLIHPQSQAKKFFLIGLGLEVLYIILLFGGIAIAAATGDPTMAAIAGPIGGLCALGAAVFIILSYFKVRASLVYYYNTVEPIGLRLSGVMTFFFNILYFQHHFKRIHDWKTTGQLVPQQVR